MQGSLDPRQYSAQVEAFLRYLHDNAQATTEARIKEFFRLLGITQQHHTALEIQHVVGLALRELLAQIASESSEAEDIRRINAHGLPFAFLEGYHLDALKEKFAIATPVVPSSDVLAHLINTSIQASFTNSNPGAIKPREAIIKALDTSVELLLENLKRDPESTILNVPGHFSVADTYVISNGNCACAALANKLAEAIGIQASAITEGQLIAYSESVNYQAKAEGNAIKSDHAKASSPLVQVYSLFDSAREAVGNSASSNEKKELLALVDNKQKQLIRGVLDIPGNKHIDAPVLALELLIEQATVADAALARTIKTDLARVNNSFQAFIDEQERIWNQAKALSATTFLNSDRRGTKAPNATVTQANT